MAATKDTGIETLRGIAILMIVAVHASTALHTDARSAWSHASFSLQYIRVPLFAALSGFVYAMRPCQPGAEAGFLMGKARRLLVPMYVIAFLWSLLHAAFPGAWQTESIGAVYERIWLPTEHLWFLMALFTCFGTLVLVERLRLLSSMLRWSVALGVSVAIALLVPLPKAAALDSASYLLPFVLLGLGFRRFWGQVPTGKIGFALAAAIGLLALQQLAWYGVLETDTAKRSVLGIATGTASCFFLLAWRPKVQALARLGAHAFPIYLFHWFAIGLATRLVPGWGWGELPALVVYLAAGLGSGVCVHWATQRLALTRLLLLGERVVGRRHASAPT